MEKSYTYDAFISYRHTELDKFVAENLHKAMETFKLPKNVSRSDTVSRKRIERVFRDKDELPLSSNLEDPIITALKESEFLIVICSPRLKESIWCKREIETFIKFHGRNKILAVLVEGEPEESFPEEILYTEETVTNPDGTTSVTKKNVEPLAADVRGGNKKEVLKALKSESLRLLAPIFGVSYDDLRQRHRDRKVKRIIATSVTASVICLAIGICSTIAALQIKMQKEQIEKQAGEISAQADEIKAQADKIKAQNDTLLNNQAKSLAEKSLDLLEKGDRIGAIKTAGLALTEYDGIAMPYTPEAKYALTESLHIYDTMNIYKAERQLTASGVIDFMSVSPDKKTVIIADETGKLSIWDISSGELLDTISDIDILDREHLTYLDNDRLAYLSNDSKLNIYSISEKKIADTIPIKYSSSVSSDINGNYLATTAFGEYNVFDAKTLQLLYSYSSKSKHILNSKCYFSDSDVMIYTETKTADTNGNDGQSENMGILSTGTTTVSFIKLSDGKSYASRTLPYDIISDVVLKGDRAYVAAGSIGDISSKRAKTTSEITAFNLEDGATVWKYALDDKLIDGIMVPETKDAKNMMIYTFGNIYMLNKENGKETAVISSGFEIAGTAVFKDSGNFLIFNRRGELGFINQDQTDYLMLKYLFDCKSDNVKKFQAADNCFLVLPYNDNKITIYTASQNIDAKSYEGEIILGNGAVKEDDNDEPETSFTDHAQELGLEKASLATFILYSGDKETVFVSYSDDTLEIYRTEDMTLLGTIDDLQSDYVKHYLGADKEGNIYISGISHGYCLDSNYNLTARIEYLLGVDSENNRLIVGNNDEKFTLPIYTTEELLQKLAD